MFPAGGWWTENPYKQYHCFCVSPLPLDVPMGSTASPPFQVAPANPVIAMATWTYPYLTAVTRSQASACDAVKVMEGQLATVVPRVTMEMPSQPKTANVSEPTDRKPQKLNKGTSQAFSCLYWLQSFESFDSCSYSIMDKNNKHPKVDY